MSARTPTRHGPRSITRAGVASATSTPPTCSAPRPRTRTSASPPTGRTRSPRLRNAGPKCGDIVGVTRAAGRAEACLTVLTEAPRPSPLPRAPRPSRWICLRRSFPLDGCLPHWRGHSSKTAVVRPPGAARAGRDRCCSAPTPHPCLTRSGLPIHDGEAPCRQTTKGAYQTGGGWADLAHGDPAGARRPVGGDRAAAAAGPAQAKGGRPRVPDRAALGGVLFVLRTGCGWEALPKELGCGRG
jgi:hypothetical protein